MPRGPSREGCGQALPPEVQPGDLVDPLESQPLCTCPESSLARSCPLPKPGDRLGHGRDETKGNLLSLQAGKMGQGWKEQVEGQRGHPGHPLVTAWKGVPVK